MSAIGPGVRVKCIRNSPMWDNALHVPRLGPGPGSVWTVRAVDGVTHPLAPPGDYFSLWEWPPQRWFHSCNFVPLDGNEDLSTLEGLLNKGPVDAPVRAPEVVE